MSQQALTLDKFQVALAFLWKRGRNVDPMPGDKAGLYKFDGHIRTGHDVIRYAIMAGWKVERSSQAMPT